MCVCVCVCGQRAGSDQETLSPSGAHQRPSACSKSMCERGCVCERERERVCGCVSVCGEREREVVLSVSVCVRERV